MMSGGESKYGHYPEVCSNLDELHIVTEILTVESREHVPSRSGFW